MDKIFEKEAVGIKISNVSKDASEALAIYNHSNNRPMGNKLIVFIDSVSAPISKGGIYIGEDTRRTQAYSKTNGIVLELGPTAFKDHDYKPSIGDRVTFRSYGGIDVQELNEEINCNLFYRILEDKEIHAIYSKTEKPTK